MMLDHTDEEKTAIRFTLSDDGTVIHTSDTEKSLIDTICGRRRSGTCGGEGGTSSISLPAHFTVIAPA